MNDKTAVSESGIQLRVERRDRVVLVLLRAQAERIADQLVDVLLHAVQARVPAVLDARDVEAAQLLQAQRDPIEHRLDLRAGLRPARLRLCVGHAASSPVQTRLARGGS